MFPPEKAEVKLRNLKTGEELSIKMDIKPDTNMPSNK